MKTNKCAGENGLVLTIVGTNVIESKTLNKNDMINCIARGPNCDVAVAQSGAIYVFENNEWRLQINSTGHPLSDVVYGNGRYVAVGDDGIILTSTSGHVWVEEPNIITTEDLIEIKFYDGFFICIGDNGTVLVSNDGSSWWQKNIIIEQCLYGITYNKLQNEIVVVGSNHTIKKLDFNSLVRRSAYTWKDAFETSDHTFSVSEKDSKSTDKSTQIHELFDIIYAYNMYIIVGSDGIQQSSDGIKWNISNPCPNVTLYSIIASDGMFIVVGDSGIILTSSDGITWTNITSGTISDLNSIA